MKQNIRIAGGAWLIGMMVLFLSSEIKAQTQSKVPPPTDSIPAFTFYTLDRKPFTDEDLSVGKRIFFIFFDVTCDHCQHAIHALSENINDCDSLSIYLVSLDNKTLINHFFKKYGKNLPGRKNVTILEDLKNEFIDRFHPRMYPSVFLYSPNRHLILYSDEDEYLNRFLKLIRAGNHG